MLAAPLLLVTLAEDTSVAVRAAFVSAGVWWAVFTLIPLATLSDPAAGARRTLGQHAGGRLPPARHDVAFVAGARTTLAFLAAYLLYNDGIPTVISQSAVYANVELGLGESTITAAVLVVQFVAMAGAYGLGLLAGRHGPKRVVLGSLVIWMGVLTAAYVLPAGRPAAFFALAALIGVVLGGTQALSRSLFSQMVPEGREAKYFSVYEISDRGTSWLARIDLRRAVAEAGNPAPARL